MYLGVCTRRTGVITLATALAQLAAIDFSVGARSQSLAVSTLLQWRPICIIFDGDEQWFREGECVAWCVWMIDESGVIAIRVKSLIF